MNTQHTQGPWYLEGHSHKLGYVVSAELQDSDPVAFVKNNHNARLIAAAPDLLDALTDLLKAIEWSETKPVHNLTTLGRAMAKAKTAIAKVGAA